MYWVLRSTTPPLNGQDVVIYNTYAPNEYRVARWYDTGEEMDDGEAAVYGGFYVQARNGKRSIVRYGITHYLPLEVPRPTEETKAKQYRRGYRAALLYVLALLEKRSKRASAGEAWAFKSLYTQLEDYAKRAMRDNFRPDLEEGKR